MVLKPLRRSRRSCLELSPVARCSIAAFAAMDSVCCSICGLYMGPGFWAIARQKHVQYNVLQHITTYYKLVNGQLALLWSNKPRGIPRDWSRSGAAQARSSWQQTACPNQRGLICRSQWCLSKKCISLVSEAFPEDWTSSLSLSLFPWWIMKALLVSWAWFWNSCLSFDFRHVSTILFLFGAVKKPKCPFRIFWIPWFGAQIGMVSFCLVPIFFQGSGEIEPVVDAERRLSYWMRWALRQSAPEAEKTFHMFQDVSENAQNWVFSTGAPGAARLSSLACRKHPYLNLSDLDLSCKNDETCTSPTSPCRIWRNLVTFTKGKPFKAILPSSAHILRNYRPRLVLNHWTTLDPQPSAPEPYTENCRS